MSVTPWHLRRASLLTACAIAFALNAPLRAEGIDDPAALQARLNATPEEWSFVYPKLQQVVALREAVPATAAAALPTRSRGGIFDSPLGGTSLDVPNMPTNGRGGTR